MFVFPPETLIFPKQLDEFDELAPVADSAVQILPATGRLLAKRDRAVGRGWNYAICNQELFLN